MRSIWSFIFISNDNVDKGNLSFNRSRQSGRDFGFVPIIFGKLQVEDVILDVGARSYPLRIEIQELCRIFLIETSAFS